MKRTIIESPFAGDTETHTAYARRCVRDSLLRGESPIASHALYTLPGILRDEIPDERTLGMEAGWAWLSVADQVAIYSDFGISGGMKAGIARAKSHGVPVVYRTIGRCDAPSYADAPFHCPGAS